MQIHVARHQQQLGVFAAEDIAAGLSSGRFFASDLAWREGMPAWTPLGDWPEFRGVGVPASPGAADQLPGETTFPWETSKRPLSAYSSFVSLIREPGAVLRGARLEFFPTLQLVWIVLSAAAISSIIGGVVHAEAIAQVMRNAGAQLAQMATGMPGETGRMYAKLADYLMMTQAKDSGDVVTQALFWVALIPFYYLALGLLQWLGLRLLGLCGEKSCKTAGLGRTAVASMLGLALLGAVLCLAALLSPLSGAHKLVMTVLAVTGIVLYFRAVGGALRISPWTVFGSVILLVVAAACCCCSFVSLLAGLGGLAAS